MFCAPFRIHNAPDKLNSSTVVAHRWDRASTQYSDKNVASYSRSLQHYSSEHFAARPSLDAIEQTVVVENSQRAQQQVMVEGCQEMNLRRERRMEVRDVRRSKQVHRPRLDCSLQQLVFVPALVLEPELEPTPEPELLVEPEPAWLALGIGERSRGPSDSRAFVVDEIY